MATEKLVNLADFAELVKQLRGDDDESLRKRAEYDAEAHLRLTRRENDTHPDISVYSYPEGNVARPKPPLKCKMFWCGYDEPWDNLTPDEIICLNHATPGNFRFHRTDGKEEKLTVTAEQDAAGKLTKMYFWFPCQGQDKHNVPSKPVLLREAYRLKDPEQDELARLREEVAVLRMSQGTSA
jgi:hypothetical protein